MHWGWVLGLRVGLGLGCGVGLGNLLGDFSRLSAVEVEPEEELLAEPTVGG